MGNVATFIQRRLDCCKESDVISSEDIEKLVPQSDIHDRDLKVVIIGSPRVGKSSLLQALTDFDSPFSETKEPPRPTIGFDFRILTRKYRGYRYRITVWDISGNSTEFLEKGHYRSCNAIFIVYDVTNYASFEAVLEMIKTSGKYTDNVFLIGNKTDLIHERKVSRTEGEEMAAKTNVKFVEANMKNTEAVEEILKSLS